MTQGHHVAIQFARGLAANQRLERARTNPGVGVGSSSAGRSAASRYTPRAARTGISSEVRNGRI
jgi:hypothetical protein